MERVYVLADPRVTDPILRVRYVGWTRKRLDQRLAKHLISARHRQTHRDCWIRGLAHAGYEPVIELYAEVATGKGLAAEVRAIALLRMLGADLTNLTIGGDGVIGYDHTAETRERLRQAHAGRRLPDGQRKNISEGLRRAWSAGRRQSPKAPSHLWTPEIRARIGAAHRGRSIPAERRARISATLTGRTASTDTRSKRSASLRAHYANPEARAHLRRQKAAARAIGTMELF